MNKNSMYRKIKIELGHSIKVLLLILLIIPFLSGCRVDESDYELTNYVGKSVDKFIKKTKSELTEDSNGVYKLEGALQLIAPKGDIRSFTILKGDEQFKLFGVAIGMNKTEAELKLLEIYNAEANKTIEADKNSVTHTYRDKDSEVYLSYDIDTGLVTELSYYYLDTESQQEDEE
ncbi:MAG: hypothetical protein GX271_09875, partial [Clostridiales bacterium]|nr:hypothetical protein [Clostridiales bacterium]